MRLVTGLVDTERWDGADHALNKLQIGRGERWKAIEEDPGHIVPAIFLRRRGMSNENPCPPEYQTDPVEQHATEPVPQEAPQVEEAPLPLPADETMAPADPVPA